MEARRRYSDAEKETALAALDANGGNVRGTAKELGIHHSVLDNWAKQREQTPEPTNAETSTSDALSASERLFVSHYLETLNGTKAARLAGYGNTDASAGTAAWRLMKKVEIRAEINKALSEQVMPVNEALKRLADFARGDMADFAHIEFPSDIQEHPQARLIKKFKKNIRTEKDGTRVEWMEVELYDAQSALVHIIKELHLEAGEPTERTELTDGLTDTERSARIAAILDAARARRDGQPPTDA